MKRRYNHWSSATDFWYRAVNDIPGRIGDPIPRPVGFSARDAFLDLIDSSGSGDGSNMKVWSYFHHIATWYAYRNLPNIKLVHYNNLKADPKGQIADIAKFINVELSDEELDKCVFQTEFNYMKSHGEAILGNQFGAMFENGGNSFLFKGTNNRWKDDLSEEDIQRYLDYGIERLGRECMHFLVTGELS